MMSQLIIADDSAVIRKVGKRILSDMGFCVRDASGPGEALQLCKIQLPETLIVDESMEGALELIAAVRELRGGEAVRIVFCILEADLKRIMQGKRAGADEYFLKPFNRASLQRVFAGCAEAA